MNYDIIIFCYLTNHLLPSISTLSSVSESEPDSDQEPGPRAGSQVAAADRQVAKSGSQAVELTPVLPFKTESEEEDRCVRQ